MIIWISISSPHVNIYQYHRRQQQQGTVSTYESSFSFYDTFLSVDWKDTNVFS